MAYVYRFYDAVVQISNFEYLMQLNTLAGRSYNDITQVVFLLNLLLSIFLKLNSSILCSSYLHHDYYLFFAVSSFPLDSF